MKYLPRFLQQLRDDEALLALFASRKEYGFIKETVDLFYKMQVNKFTNEDMHDLYKRGMIYKELAKVSSRQFQSVSTSLSRYLTDKDKKMSRANRKLWVSLMNYVFYVYETDKAGSWDVLQEKLPEKSLNHLRQMYRLSGGSYMMHLVKIQREAENAQIKCLLELGMSAEEISNALSIPMSTLYYRIGVITGREQEQDTDTEVADDDDTDLNLVAQELAQDESDEEVDED